MLKRAIVKIENEMFVKNKFSVCVYIIILQNALFQQVK